MSGTSRGASSGGTSALERKVYGLTGGVASGKSTVAKLLARAGFFVVDADQIAREVGAPGGAAHAAILERFGTADRAELRKRVFADPHARQDLEGILHPLIQAESLRRIQSAPGDAPVIYEAALLVETGRYKDLDGLIVVYAPKELRLARLVARDSIPADFAERMIDAQASDAERLRAATHVIDNSASLDDLAAKTADLAAKLDPAS